MREEMKTYTNPIVRVLRYDSGILCQSNPSGHEHGWNGNGNGKGWGQGGKPRHISPFEPPTDDLYE